MREQTRVRPSWPLYVFFFLVAGIVAAGVSSIYLGQSLAALGIPDPGILTTAGLPLIRAGALIFACLSVGSFLLCSFLAIPRKNGYLSADGMIASGTGSFSALAFAICSLLLVPFSLSDVSGQPLSAALAPARWSAAIDQVAAARAWEWCAIFGFATAILAFFSKKWIMQPVWLLCSLFMLVPLGLQGHSASGGDHDYGTNSYLLHMIFMALWVGGLMAVIAHALRKGHHLDVVVRRYSKLALVSAVVMVFSGIINVLVRISPSDLFNSSYGHLIIIKTIIVLVVIVIGYIHREISIPHLKDRPRTFVRIAVGEVVLMAVIMAIGVALGRTPPPPPRINEINNMIVEIGYELHKAPTFWNVWTMWRFDLIFGSMAIIFAALYIWGVIKVRKLGGSWPVNRTVWWLIGCLMLGLTMCSGIGMYMPAMFSVHMVGHMILSMFVPVPLVLGAPFTLIKEANPANPERPGLHEWTEQLTNNRFIAFITHPAFNTIQFLIFFYALYLQSIYTVAISQHAGHLAMNLLFILSGYVYFWELIGADPVPTRRNPAIRAIWLTASLPMHMFFGVALMQMTAILGYDFYSSLGLPWNIDLLSDQNVGGGVAWGMGQFPLVLVYIVVMRQWYLFGKKENADYDKRAEETNDAELRAYNEMLQKMSRRR
ncbi:MAG: cytochrome c oxidase assembly protein [Corynebacterium sp.]|nr:cytochrome c oxidase assembly protein [Corynebacterium sp.]